MFSLDSRISQTSMKLKSFKRLHLIRWALTSAMVVSAFPCPSFCGEPIKATVEFSRSLPALGDEYKEGGEFHLQAGNSVAQKLKWRRVPRWLAGVWHTEYTSRLVAGIPVRYPTKADFISGFQADNKGHIWHPIINRVSRVDGDTYFEYQIMQGDQTFIVDKESSTRFTRSTRIRVNKKNGRIIGSFQQEEKAVSRPLEDGVVQVTADCRTFDKSGKLLFEQTIYVVQARTEPFHAIDSYGGVDYFASLNEFLKAEGKDDLIASAHESIAPDELQSRILNDEDRNQKLMEGVAK